MINKTCFSIKINDTTEGRIVEGFVYSVQRFFSQPEQKDRATYKSHVCICVFSEAVVVTISISYQIRENLSPS